MKAFMIAALATIATVTAVEAASPCKGLDQQQCGELKVGDINVCRWQGEYYTTGGIRGNFCTTSGKKLTKELYEQLQTQLQANTTPAPAN